MIFTARHKRVGFRRPKLETMVAYQKNGAYDKRRVRVVFEGYRMKGEEELKEKNI